MIHVQDGTINFSPIIQKINAYHKKENNGSDNSSMVLIYDNNLCDIIISVNIDLSGNRIIESRDYLLLSIQMVLHMGDAKYRI